MKTIKPYIITCLLVALTGCGNFPKTASEPTAPAHQEYHPDLKPAGIALTFDDRNVDEWFACRELFNRYNARATFYIVRPDKLRADQIEKLKILQQDGHEIACHGLNHISLYDYGKTEEQIRKYVDEEVLPALKILRDQGFDVRNFSYPFGKRHQLADALILQHVQTVRSTAYMPENRPVNWLPYIYYRRDRNIQVLFGLGLDRTLESDLSTLMPGFERALTENEVMIFYAHRPVAGPGEGKYDLPRDLLEKLLKTAAEMNLSYYRIRDLQHQPLPDEPAQPS